MPLDLLYRTLSRANQPTKQTELTRENEQMHYAEPPPPPKEEKSHGCLYSWYVHNSHHPFVVYNCKSATNVRFLLKRRRSLLLLGVWRDLRVLFRVS